MVKKLFRISLKKGKDPRSKKRSKKRSYRRDILKTEKYKESLGFQGLVSRFPMKTPLGVISVEKIF